LLVWVLLATQPASPLPQTSTKLRKEVRRVLIFNELGLWSPGVAAINKEIFAALEESPYQVEFYSEDLDTSLFPKQASQLEFRDWYFRKYENRKPDLIIAIGPSAMEFMSDSHQTFSPDTPIVFWGSTEESAEPPKLDPDFTGVWGVAQPDKTLDIALQLQPGTKHVVVVGGVAPYDRHLEALVKNRFHQYESKFDFTYLTDLAMPDLLERLKHLPSGTIVYHTSIMQDGAGSHFIDATQSVPLVAGAANAPVFAVDDVDVGKGTVGGYVFSFTLAGKEMGTIAIRILNGEKPQDIPIVKGANLYMFDWRALKRWGLKESAVPSGSTVLNRRPTVWEFYKWYILGGISLLCLQALIIVALLWQRAGRRKAETELVLSHNRLRESEERFRLVANTAPVLIWMSGPDKQCNYFNQPWLEFTGRSVDAELGSGWAEGVHPEDFRACLDTYTKAFERHQSFQMEYRLRRNDGEYRWVFDIGVPRFDQDGSFAGYIGSCIDVTERRMAEKALASLSGRLIDAQEEERKRIAREIHDDYNQRLALVANTLGELAVHSEESPQALGQQLHELWNGVSEVAADLHGLSHSLHSSTLESLGLTAGVKAFCKEFAEQQQMQVSFAHENVPSSIPADLALCLFRITQEGLRNIKRHSGSSRAEVRLEMVKETLHLSVSDWGRGFDMKNRSPQSGIGIRSMEERLRFLGGYLEVHSRPTEGTRIDAWLPLEAARRLAS
jgi:PAS domain S-box-containing protein